MEKLRTPCVTGDNSSLTLTDDNCVTLTGDNSSPPIGVR